MAKESRDLSASVRTRLLQLAKASEQPSIWFPTRFALERLIFRLSQSPHASRSVLKGAMLTMSWFDAETLRVDRVREGLEHFRSVHDRRQRDQRL